VKITRSRRIKLSSFWHIFGMHPVLIWIGTQTIMIEVCPSLSSVPPDKRREISSKCAQALPSTSLCTVYISALGSSDDLALNGTTIHEVERWRRKWSWPNVRYDPRIYLEGLRKITNNFSLDRRSRCRRLNPGPPEHEAGCYPICRNFQPSTYFRIHDWLSSNHWALYSLCYR
jgi:hypothetical protein